MARIKEKQSSRSGNVSPPSLAPSTVPTEELSAEPSVELSTDTSATQFSEPEQFDAMTASESLHDLVERCTDQIQEGIDKTLHFTGEQMESAVLIIMDGSSPLAPIDMQQKGKAAARVGLISRKKLVDFTASKNEDLSRSLSRPLQCGHLQYFVSTSLGAALACVLCDLRMKPVVLADHTTFSGKSVN